MSQPKNFIDNILGDVTKTSAVQQIVMGTISGWGTGFLATKFGEVVALLVGGGIIMFQIAVNQGYINLNWSKMQKEGGKLSDKITGKEPKFMDKVGSYVDKKLDKAGEALKSGETGTRRWYHSLSPDGIFRPREIHFFLASFATGVAIALAN